MVNAAHLHNVPGRRKSDVLDCHAPPFTDTCAFARPEMALVMPGPETTRQAPGRPVR